MLIKKVENILKLFTVSLIVPFFYAYQALNMFFNIEKNKKWAFQNISEWMMDN